MMTIEVILGVILLHWFADFVLQTHWQATNKSTNPNALIAHTAIYSTVIAVASLLYYGVIFGLPALALVVLWATFVLHTATDYVTSKINSWFWKKGDVHNFFVSVGFDQVLHYSQLFGTYYLIDKIFIGG